MFQRETEHDTTRPGTSKTIRHSDSSATEARPREMQYKREAIVNKAGDNPDEEWSVGWRELWTPLRYFEEYSIMTYGILLGGSSPNGNKIFTLQKKTVLINGWRQT
jgi:hypothetical protein